MREMSPMDYQFPSMDSEAKQEAKRVAKSHWDELDSSMLQKALDDNTNFRKIPFRDYMKRLSEELPDELSDLESANIIEEILEERKEKISRELRGE